MIHEESAGGTLQKSYVMSSPQAEVGRILADIAGTDPATGTARYYAHDHLGSMAVCGSDDDEGKRAGERIRSLVHGETYFALSRLCVLLFTFVALVGCTARPIEISSIEELQMIGRDRAYPLNGYYELSNDIDATITADWNNGEGFAPIHGFTGVFEGNGYTIHNITINRPTEDGVGVFGSVTGNWFSYWFDTRARKRAIRNTNLKSCVIIGNSSVGGLIGYMETGSVSNCFVEGEVSGTSNDTEHSIYIYNSKENIGGLIGITRGGEIINSHTSVHVRGRGLVGGLVGRAWKTRTIRDCSSYGAVEGGGSVGGLIGWVGDSMGGNCQISRCFSTASVRGGNHVGGLIGLSLYNSEAVSECFATGQVVGAEDVGGLIGAALGSNVINCYAHGSVQGRYKVGGFIGSQASSTIQNSYSTGSVTGERDYGYGGLIAYSLDRDGVGKIEGVFWDIESSGVEFSSEGKGLLTEVMKTRSTYVDAGWDFEQVWTIDEHQEYPVLRNAPPPGS